MGVLINTAINLQSNQLDQLVSDYSNWDEMGYIQNPNQEWAKDNIGSIIKSFKLFNVSVYNQDLRLIYNYGNQPGGVLNDSITRTDIIKIILKKEQIHFFQATADGLQEISAASIHPTSDTSHVTPSAGIFFLTKSWDYHFLETMSINTGSKIYF